MATTNNRDRSTKSDWVANYPYEDIGLLVHLINDKGDVQVLIRGSVDLTSENNEECDCFGRRPIGPGVRPLREDIDFAVLHGDRDPRWCDVDQLEHSARLADTFGLGPIADDFREAIGRMDASRDA